MANLAADRCRGDRSDLRLRQRVPRRRQLDRHGGGDPSAAAVAGSDLGGVLELHRVRGASVEGGQRDRQDHRQRCGVDRPRLRRSGRRDRLERGHRVPRVAVVVVACADRWHGRRRHRQGRRPRRQPRPAAEDGGVHRLLTAARSAAGLRPDRAGDVAGPPQSQQATRQPHVSQPAAGVGGSVQPRSRRQRRPEDDGHHRCAAGRVRTSSTPTFSTIPTRCRCGSCCRVTARLHLAPCSAAGVSCARWAPS